MPSDIFAALNKLKKEIVEINNRQELVENREGLDDTKMSAQMFVNRELLPEANFVNYPDNKAVAEYSNLALQAVWNIAHYASRGYASAIWNQKAIVEAFQFLDENWVPKIIDEQTNQVGLALQTFLNTALDEEVLDNITIPKGVKDGIRQTLTGLQKKLEHRLKVYETHTPEHVSTAVKGIQVKRDSQAAWKQNMDETFDKVNPQMYYKYFQGPLNSDYAELEKKLEVLDGYSKLFDEAAESFRSYNEKWNKANLEKKLPPKVSASAYIFSLADENQTSQENLAKLSEVYNKPNYKILDENIGISLQRTYNTTEDMINYLKQNNLQIIEVQKQLLQEYITDSKSLFDFEKSLEQAVSSLKPVVIPEEIQSLIDNPEHSFVDDQIDSYDKLIKQIESSQAKLLEHQKLLDTKVSNFETANPIPSLETKDHLSAFEKARSDAGEKLDLKVKANKDQITTIKALLDKANAKVVDLHYEQAKQSKMGRKRILEEAGTRTKEAFKEMHENSRPREVSAKYQSQLIHQRYPAAVQTIKKQYSPQIRALEEQIGTIKAQIPSKEDGLEAIKSKSEQRKELLQTSLEELKQYQTVLEKEQGLYMPSGQVPKDRLIKNLECNDEIAAFIDGMYVNEQTAASWYGFNRTNLYNNYSHYSSLLGPSDLEADLGDVIDYISRKIDLIDQEMKIDVTVEAISPISSPQLLGEGNLWKLQEEYQGIKQEKNKLEAEVKKTEETLQSLTATMNEELNSLESRKIAIDERLTFATLEEKINTIDHGLAMVSSDSHLLAFRIEEVIQAQQKLEAISEEIDKMEHGEALKYYESVKDEITKINVDDMMNHRENFRDKSGAELQKNIGNSLKALVSNLDKLKSEENNIDKSETLSSKLKRVRDNFEALKERNVKLKNEPVGLDFAVKKLQETNAGLMTAINDSIAKHKLAALEEMLQSKYPELNGSSVRPDTKEDRDSQIREIEQFFGPLAEFKKHTNESIREKYQHISKIAQPLKEYFIPLKLDVILEETSGFIERFHSRERHGLLAEIKQFEAREGTFLNELKSSDSLEIQEKLKLIKNNENQLAVQKDILSPDSPDQSLEFFSPAPDAIPEEQPQRETGPKLETSPIESLMDKYFTDRSGVFPQYLAERAHKFWLKDFFRSFAALTFGCFGYKTDAQVRETYVNELTDVFENYKKDSSEENRLQLLDKIDIGQDQFSPRAKVGEERYNESLHSKLQDLKKSISEVPEQEVVIELQSPQMH
ncbi:hypothetical protein TUM19329_16380 [Legionella antarctica]|uniref:Uncharacterized protein n=1 Tax=Legionella antarctica TaxID=2708020 RepID=A0A6F8T543_9GAMM|nr:hypothetical protein [Legionella antarctica]BCA95277.1 hypothetical protein TUM19329_16380 [Legionella antarctica]